MPAILYSRQFFYLWSPHMILWPVIDPITSLYPEHMTKQNIKKDLTKIMKNWKKIADAHFWLKMGCFTI